MLLPRTSFTCERNARYVVGDNSIPSEIAVIWVIAHARIYTLPRMLADSNMFEIVVDVYNFVWLRHNMLVTTVSFAL